MRVLLAVLAALGAGIASGASSSSWDQTGDFAGADHVEKRGTQCVVLTWDKPDRRPVWFGGRSRSVDAGGTGDYSIYLDVQYADCSWKWAVCARYTRGTHDWEARAQVFEPEKPVARIEYFMFLRRAGTGHADFDGAFLRRERPPEGALLQERAFSMQPVKDALRVQELRVAGKGKKTAFSERPLAPRACPLAEGEAAVWTADSMRRVYPLDFPSAAERAAPAIELELARGECESAQVCVSCGKGVPAGDASLSVAGDFPGAVEVRRVGYFARRDGYRSHSLGRADDELWFPEPLLPGLPPSRTGDRRAPETGGSPRTGDRRAPCMLRTVPGGTVGAWITFKASRDAPAGVYAGAVAVSVGGREAKVPYRVRVRDFALPARFGLKTAYSVMDGFIRGTYPEDFKARKREAWDLMLDHRLNPDDISRTTPPDLDDLAYAAKRGMNSFNVLNLVPPSRDPNARWVCWADPQAAFSEETYAYFRKTLTPYVAELKRRGLDKYAYVYGFDERGTEFYDRLLPLWRRLKGDFGLPVMTTAYMYRDVTQGKLAFESPLATMTDIHVPLESVYDPALSDRYRAQGREVWWYTCCGPTEPWCSNASYEYPLVECRVLGWVLRRTRSDGYLFWHVNYWERDKLDERETFFPDWNTYSGLGMPGDGIFLYPGREHVLGGIRLANVRDGVEDYEWLQLAEQAAGRGKVEEILREVAESGKSFTRAPVVVRRARARLADLIEKKQEQP